MKGFTLIEVLVTLIIFCCGMLTLSQALVFALRQQHQTLHAAQKVQQQYNCLERHMHA